MAGDIGYTTAFVAGLATFLSPCVLPLVPGYLSFMSGISYEEMMAGKGRTATRVVSRSALFVLGFSLVFVVLGAAATAVGGFLGRHRYLLGKAAGVLIILFGLHMMGLFRFRFLMAEHRYQGRVMGGAIGALLLGMVFALGWSPCYGPIIAVILSYAAIQETVWKGIVLLAIYSAGLGLPFLLIGMGMGTFVRFLDRFGRHLRWVEAASGALLVVFGFLMLTGWLAKLSLLIS